MAERRPWRVVDAELFRFTTTELHDLHVAVMAAFEQAAVLAPALNLDQVRAALAAGGWDEPTDDDTLQRALASLVGWGLLDATQDHAARYGTPEEFERKNLQWSLTPRGEAAVAGVMHALDSLRHAVGLQTAVLDAIGDGLADLAALATVQPRTVAGDARVHIQLAQVEGHLDSLVRSVRSFNGHLQRLMKEDGTDDEVFADAKRATVNYLDEYVQGVERPQRRLAVGIERVEALGLATVFDRALAGANLAPVAGADPGPAWLAERRRAYHAAVPALGLVEGAQRRVAASILRLDQAFPRAVSEVYSGPDHRPLDVVAFNFYDPVVGHRLRLPGRRTAGGRAWTPLRQIWDDTVDPDALALYCPLNHEPGLDLWVAENGLCNRVVDGHAVPRTDGWDRVSFLRANLAAVEGVAASGVPVTRYFHWSLADNYEWGSYQHRFGLYRVDQVPGASPVWHDLDAFGHDAAGEYRLLAGTGGPGPQNLRGNRGRNAHGSRAGFRAGR